MFVQKKTTSRMKYKLTALNGEQYTFNFFEKETILLFLLTHSLTIISIVYAP